MSKWRIAGISFEHEHMGDLLRQVHEHPNAEIVGICDADPQRMATAIGNFAIPPEHIFTEVETCLAASRPDLVMLCSATARHADFVERLAPHGVHILVEKPFAASLAEPCCHTALQRSISTCSPLAFVSSSVLLEVAMVKPMSFGSEPSPRMFSR